MSDPRELLRHERLETVALLESLGPADWDVASLCDGWTVREVAAHLAYASTVTPAHTVVGLLRSRFDVNRFIRESARRWAADHTHDELLTRLRAEAGSGARPPFVPAQAPLSDAVVHGLDMRVPLGRAVPVQPEAFTILADWHAGLRWPGTVMVGDPRRRIDGVRLVCDDVPWSRGEGPAVHARSDTLLLLLAGRPVGPDQLSGPGANLVRTRL